MSGASEAGADRLLARFLAAGAIRIHPPILQPAKILLDLYGEDIRARAYTVRDPREGEMMLRPDFTMPVARMHLETGGGPARYAYAGKVFRIQEAGSDRPTEYDQAGFELFGGRNAAQADAEVFALFAEILSPMGLRAATGDLGVLAAAIGGLATSPERKAALMRHIWRPRRFRALLDRFGGRSPVPPSRVALLERVAAGEDVLAAGGPVVGTRTEAEIAARVAALAADAVEPPIAEAEVNLLDDILELRARMPDALARLREIAAKLPSISDALALMEARMESLAVKGVDVATLEFEGSYGRTTLEYYDGFVFGFYAENRPDLPSVATGGRYDALTRVLGQGRVEPAVGGAIRPAMLAEISE